MYGKSPPKDLLSKSEKQVKKAIQNLESLQIQFDDAKEDWDRKFGDTNYRWRNKLDLKYQQYLNQERFLKEKLRHLKSDVAAANKEVIKEKVQIALLRSRSVIEGHIAELFPMFRKTRINPADLCSLIPTQPIDFVVFDGLFQKEVKSITFLDVKKGKSGLTHVQKTIRDTINDGNVKFRKLRVNFDNVKGTAVEES